MQTIPIEIKQDSVTGYWYVFIHGKDTMKAKRLLTVVRTLVKYVKGHPEIDKVD